MPSAGPSRRRGRTEGRTNRADERVGAGMLPRKESSREDLAPWCQSRMEEGGVVPPPSVLAPGTALGLLRSRALPSAQAKGIVAASPCWRIGQDREEIERTKGR